MNILKRTFLLVACMVLISILLQSEDFVITAEGQASGSGPGAVEKATDNALRSAIEQGFGIYIDSTTVAENNALISDDVIAESKGFIRSYETLDQRESDGLTFVKVRAVISMDKIWESDSLNLLLKRMGTPRFIIISSEDINGEPPKGNPAVQRLTELLVNRGFHLSDAFKNENYSMLDRAQIVDNLNQATKLGRSVNAEIVVLINAKVTFEKTATLYGKKMTYFNGIADVKVVQTDSKRIIASTVGKAIRGAENPDEAVNDTFAFAVEDASEELIKGVLSSWSKYLNMGRSIEIVIKNVSVSRLMRIIEALKGLEGVSSVSQRKYSGGVAQIEMKSKHQAMYLAESIETLPGFKLKISDFSADKITVINRQ